MEQQEYYKIRWCKTKITKNEWIVEVLDIDNRRINHTYSIGWFELRFDIAFFKSLYNTKDARKYKKNEIAPY